MNRRHTAILFVTLVLTGSALLAGAELKEALGMMMLGVALAWAVGSHAALKAYSNLKGITSTLSLCTRLPLVMIFAGCVLGAAFIFSRGNPVVPIAAMCIVGILIAPLTSLPVQKLWLRIPLLLLAGAAFFLAATASVALDTFGYQNGYRFGQLMQMAFLALLGGIWWLSKGWKLIHRGISVATMPAPAPVDGLRKATLGQSVSVFLGVIIVTLSLGVLAFSASSDWAYAPQELKQSNPNENPVVQAAFILLLAWWPYIVWNKILDREPNSDAKNVRRHRLITAAAGMIFSVVLCLAASFGAQNGNDRIMTEQITNIGIELGKVATKIGTIKQRDLKTTGDYIQAYSEIEPLLPEFDSKIQRCAEIYQEARQRDESRGPMNIQRFYKSNTPELWQNSFSMLELLRQASALTKQQILTAVDMSALPEGDQPKFWQERFKTLLEQEDALRKKILALQTKMQPATNSK